MSAAGSARESQTDVLRRSSLCWEFLITAEVWMCACGGEKVVVAVAAAAAVSWVVPEESLKVENRKQTSNSGSKPP